MMETRTCAYDGLRFPSDDELIAHWAKAHGIHLSFPSSALSRNVRYGGIPP